MHSVRNLLLPLILLVFGLGLQLLLLRGGKIPWGPRQDGPQTLADAGRLAAGQGLYVINGDQRDGSAVRRLVVSERPLNWERANLLRFGNPHHPCWDGTVAVCFPAGEYLEDVDVDCAAIWGRTLLYGDPGLIDRLTGRRERGMATACIGVNDFCATAR